MREMQLSVIPRPVSIQYKEGVFQSRGLPSLKGDGEFHKEIEIAAGQLCRDLEGMGYSAANRTEPSILCQKETVQTDADESYRLCISKENIVLDAASGAGMYHGLQTLRQLVLSEYHDGMLVLPCAEITDYPRFSWRGFMLDCSRYFYSVPFIKRLMDVLSLHHINRFHWHLTDDQGWRLPVSEYPLLTEIGSRRLERNMPGLYYTDGFYREDEIRDIVEYAASRHIEVIPEVNLPGHTSAILASYPGLGCTGGPYRVEDRFGIFEDVLCAGNSQIFDLAEKIFDTLVRLFPSPFVHIGGDEVLFYRWGACPKCQKKLAELGLKNPKGLQSWLTVRFVQLLAERGRTAIGWDEIMEDTVQFRLPKEVVVMSWRGSGGGMLASSRGHRVIMSPNTEGCYLDYKHTDDPEEPGQTLGLSSVFRGYSMDPVTPAMTPEAASRILGGQCNLWSELIRAGKIA